MATGKKLFGRATVKLAGVTLGNFPGATLDMGGIKRTTQNGANATLGYTEEIMNSKIELDAQFGAGDSVADYDQAGIMVEFSTDTGQNFVISNAWRTDTMTLAEGGKVKLVFEGSPAEEVL